MNVQIQRPAEPLHDGDGTATPVRGSVALCGILYNTQNPAEQRRLLFLKQELRCQDDPV